MKNIILLFNQIKIEYTIDRLTELEDFLTFDIIGEILGERVTRSSSSSSSLSLFVILLLTIFLLFDILS